MALTSDIGICSLNELIYCLVGEDPAPVNQNPFVPVIGFYGIDDRRRGRVRITAVFVLLNYLDLPGLIEFSLPTAPDLIFNDRKGVDKALALEVIDHRINCL